MRIAIVTEAWFPQVNGVVRTLSTVAAILRAEGHLVEVIGPDRFRTLPCPTYPEIRLAPFPRRRLDAILRGIRPQALHIATEGPLGLAARAWAIRRGLPFTTSFHTRFPEYLRARTGLPPGLAYAALRRFHDRAERTLVPTPSMGAALRARGFRRVSPWTRGVDLDRFTPDRRRDWATEFDLPRPILLHVGRIAVEKNIPAFLDLDLPGSKVVVGGGPLLPELRSRYPGVLFTGPLADAELASAYAGADVFVFPSVTDTFGLVVLEALASGLPVAAFDVTGPADILAGAPPEAGIVSSDLRTAVLHAASLDRERARAAARAHASRFTWSACARIFRDALAPFPTPAPTGS
ncbi:MAG: glycosyltransferase family 1 protein [Gluconacetobacter diazotrophicus]|nr:glycosyltransferase family 1 protein [Gluconacetobacter diazotrophicus]